jgi:hypothetical protein
MGTLTYYGENSVPLVYELVASRSIAAREKIAPTVEEIIEAAQNNPNPFPRITVELVVLYVLLPAAGIYLLFRFLKAGFRLLKKRKRIRTVKPTSRYYR